MVHRVALLVHYCCSSGTLLLNAGLLLLITPTMSSQDILHYHMLLIHIPPPMLYTPAWHFNNSSQHPDSAQILHNMYSGTFICPKPTILTHIPRPAETSPRHYILMHSLATIEEVRHALLNKCKTRFKSQLCKSMVITWPSHIPSHLDRDKQVEYYS